MGILKEWSFLGEATIGAIAIARRYLQIRLAFSHLIIVRIFRDYLGSKR